MCNKRTVSAIVVSLALVFLFGLAGCGKKAQITGTILDGFGTPLKEAIVSIEDSTFKTTTDDQGKYAIGYVPGKIKVVFSKVGYTSATLSLDIATESTFPAQPVTLYKIPATKGIWLFGKSDYSALPKGKVAYNKAQFPFSWNKPLFEHTYKAEGQFAVIEKGTTLKFLDNDVIEQTLYKLTDDDIIIKKINYFVRENNQSHAKVVTERGHGITRDILVREVSVDKGKYAFASKGFFVSALDYREVADPIYLFEVK